MSLTGKILTVMNFLGAFGLICLASMDYAKRQAWAHSVFLYERVLEGLPLNKEEVDAENVPLADRLPEDSLKVLFGPVGGGEVGTQVQEVERLKGQLDGKLQQQANSPGQQAYLLSRMLLYLAADYVQREAMLACRAHLATNQTARALHDRALAAFNKVKDTAYQPQRNLPEAYRLAFRVEGGPPAERFVTLLLRQMGTDDRGRLGSVNFEQAYTKALQAQRDALLSRYNALFDEALGKAAPVEAANPKPGQQLQKDAIARLLLGLSPYLAEDAEGLRTNPDIDRPAYQRALIGSKTFRERFLRRVYVVCGLRGGQRALSERAAQLHRLAVDYVNPSIAQERDQFVLDHGLLIAAVREQAALVRAEDAFIKESEEKINGAPGVPDSGLKYVVGARKKEIETLKKDLEESEGETARATGQLREASQELLQLRQLIRDAIRDNERGEKRIRELEKQVRDLESKR